jgi:hypothetical protein
MSTLLEWGTLSDRMPRVFQRVASLSLSENRARPSKNVVTRYTAAAVPRPSSQRWELDAVTAVHHIRGGAEYSTLMQNLQADPETARWHWVPLTVTVPDHRLRL